MPLGRLTTIKSLISSLHRGNNENIKLGPQTGNLTMWVTCGSIQRPYMPDASDFLMREHVLTGGRLVGNGDVGTKHMGNPAPTGPPGRRQRKTKVATPPTLPSLRKY